MARVLRCARELSVGCESFTQMEQEKAVGCRTNIEIRHGLEPLQHSLGMGLAFRVKSNIPTFGRGGTSTISIGPGLALLGQGRGDARKLTRLIGNLTRTVIW